MHVVEVLTQSGAIKTHPKSARSRRVVPLEDRALEALAVQQETWRDGLVFRTEGQRPGRPMIETNWRRRAWLPAVEALAGPKPTPHDLRHTFASRLVADGVDMATVQAALGHESLQTTGRYVHAAPESGARVRAALRRMASDEDRRRETS